MTASVPLREESLGANAEELYILPHGAVLPIPMCNPRQLPVATTSERGEPLPAVLTR